MSMLFKIKKSLLGKYVVSYACPKCSSNLTSPLNDAGITDTCPDCGAQFVVPGTAELENIRKRNEQNVLEKEQQRERKQSVIEAKTAYEEEARREEQRRIQAERHLEAEVSRAIRSIIISTGDLKLEYTIIDTVFALESHGEAGILFGTSGNPHKAFEGVKTQLRELGYRLGADAIINCQFEYRVAVAGEGYAAQQAIEIFAYGTAVKMANSEH